MFVKGHFWVAMRKFVVTFICLKYLLNPFLEMKVGSTGPASISDDISIRVTGTQQRISESVPHHLTKMAAGVGGILPSSSYVTRVCVSMRFIRAANDWRSRIRHQPEKRRGGFAPPPPPGTFGKSFF